MGDMGDFWRDVKAASREHKARTYPARAAEVEALAAAGFSVVGRDGGNVFRIDGVLDLYPTNRKFHHIPTKKRGSYRDAKFIALAFIKKEKK